MLKKITFLIFVFCYVFLYSAEIIGTVYKVIDGDTIIILDDDKEEIKTNNKKVKIINQGKYKVRLADIDAPESKQRFGEQSKTHLQIILNTEKILVKFHKIDVYGRVVGTIYLINPLGFSYNESINEKMVKDGYAWWYKDYSKKIWFEELEKEARLNKKGIWNDENNIPPWIFRKKHKK